MKPSTTPAGKPSPTPIPTAWQVNDAAEHAVSALVVHVKECEKQLSTATAEYEEAGRLIESLGRDIEIKAVALQHAKEALRQAHALDTASKKCGA